MLYFYTSTLRFFYNLSLKFLTIKKAADTDDRIFSLCLMFKRESFSKPHARTVPAPANKDLFLVPTPAPDQRP